MAETENNHKPDIPPIPADDSTDSSLGEHNSTDIPATPTVNNISSSQAGEQNSTSLSGNKTGSPKSAVSVVNDQGIVNLSNVTLSNTERQLLIKGLSFCPSPGECSLSNVKIAVDKLHRSLRLAHIFQWKLRFLRAGRGRRFLTQKILSPIDLDPSW